MRYPEFLLGSTRWEGQGVNIHSMFGWNRLLFEFTGDTSPGLLPLIALSIPTLALTFFVLRHPWQPDDPSFLIQAASVLVATLLVNPHLYLQDMVQMLLVFGFIAAYALRIGDNMEVVGLAGALAWLLMRGILGLSHLPLVPLRWSAARFGS